MEAVVTVGVAGSLFMVGFKGWIDAFFVAILRGEGYDGGVSTC
jgi:hypothetical protein